MKPTIDELATLLSFWIHDSHLQTFEDRERFRSEAKAALARLDESAMLPPSPMEQALLKRALINASEIKSEPRGCPTPGACSCPGAADSAGNGTPKTDAEMSALIAECAKEAGFIPVPAGSGTPEELDNWISELLLRLDSQHIIANEELAAGLRSLRSHLAAAEVALAVAQKKLPDAMQDCTILFKECEQGHGWLTATNWIQFDCPTCRLATAEAELSSIKTFTTGLIKDNHASGPVVEMLNLKFYEVTRRAERAEAALAETDSRLKVALHMKDYTFDEALNVIDGLREDAERFKWYFEWTAKKEDFLTIYVLGIRERWTIVQWRAAIDTARKERT